MSALFGNKEEKAHVLHSVNGVGITGSRHSLAERETERSSEKEREGARTIFRSNPVLCFCKIKPHCVQGTSSGKSCVCILFYKSTYITSRATTSHSHHTRSICCSV